MNHPAQPAPAASNILTKTERRAENEKRDVMRVEYFARGLRNRHWPKSRAENDCIERMAEASWKLKSADLAERDLAPEGCFLLRPFKQKAYNDYVAALGRLSAPTGTLAAGCLRIALSIF